MSIIFFKNQLEFRKWLRKNHKKETELFVGFYKVGGENKGITWSQSVDEALCFGWIDGVRKSIDKNSYQIRFTRRKSSSIWSAINIKKMEILIGQGLMQPEGLASFEQRTAERSAIYPHENEITNFTLKFQNQFKANKAAWKYFQSLSPSYKKLSANWVMNAKLEATKQKRLTELMNDSEHGTNKWKDNKYKKK